MHPTPWGFDNPRAFGAMEVGWTGGGYTTTTGGASANVSGMQTITKIRTLIDIMIDYGATFAPFSHGIITAGDDGSGTVLPSANNIMKSTNQLMLQYIKEKEEAGLCRVRDGFTGLWYGVGR